MNLYYLLVSDFQCWQERNLFGPVCVLPSDRIIVYENGDDRTFEGAYCTSLMSDNFEFLHF